MANGTIAIPPGILQKPQNQSSTATSRAARRAAQPRLKILVRRLPPGLTEQEFATSLGPEWNLGAGQIDWFVYRPGKVSRDPAKPSRAARAYVRVTDPTLVQALSEKVRQTSFQDAKNTTKDLALLGPPTVEYAPYTKTPASKRRKDARQGTIDQDPEFMAFLDSLTDPIQKPVMDLELGLKQERWLTTPLIEHIREKKAKKDKPAVTKTPKKDAKEAPAPKAKVKETPGASTSTVASDKTKKPPKAARSKESVKVLNRSSKATASTTTAPATGSAASVSAASNEGKSSSPSAQEPTKKAAPERRRERAPAPFNLAAKIQRDLGLNPSPRRASGAVKEAASPSASAPTEAKVNNSATTSSASKAAAQSNANPKREVQTPNRRNSKPSKPEAEAAAPVSVHSKVPNAPSTTKAQGAPVAHTAASTQPGSSTTSTRAFLKHANASQGITEALLKTALSAFGPVIKVEIDQKKGTALADFQTAQGLAAAVAKGRIEVAKGAVAVSGYRERPARAPRGAPAVAINAPTAGQSGASASTTSQTVPAATSSEAGRARGGRGRGGRGRTASKAVVGTKAAGSTTAASNSAESAGNG